MFSKACQLLVDNFGKDSLIPVPSLDEQNNVKLLQLVVMEETQKLIFFKYHSPRTTEFQLEDVLQDQNSIDVTETNEELSPHFEYSQTFSLKAKAVVSWTDILSLAAEATGTGTIQVKFGRVVKTQVAEPMLLQQIIERRLNLNHTFIKEVLKDKGSFLGIVTGVVHVTEEGCINRDTSLGASAEASGMVDPNLIELKFSAEANVKCHHKFTLRNNAAMAYNVNGLTINVTDGSMEMSTVKKSSGCFMK